MNDKVKLVNDITKEQCLYDVFLITLKIKMSNFDKYVCVMSFVISALFGWLVCQNYQLIIDIRYFLSFGLGYIPTTLGFLISGFTIFATLSKPNLWITMVEIPKKNIGISTLKYSFAVFMKVFIHYLIILIVYLILSIALNQPGRHMIQLVNSINLPYTACFTYLMILMLYSLLCTSLIYLVLLLKSFIFNIYAIVMFGIRWEYSQSQIDNNRIRNKKDRFRIKNYRVRG